jgi:diguanylate cyclase (GGDEF)-like protein
MSEDSALLEALFDHAPVGIGFADGGGRYVRVNPPFAAAGSLLRRSTLPLVARVLETGKHVVGEEVAGEAHELWIVSCYPVAWEDGVLGVVTFVLDATPVRVVETRLEELLALEQATRLEVELARHDLERQASIDSLTGLLNRSSLAEHLELALARAERSRLCVALLYVDLDGFKAVNDTFGHAAGDELLCAVAGRLRAAARKTDVVARLGGDEFLVLLADLAPGQAVDAERTVAQRIIEDVLQPVPLACGEGWVAASVGISVYPADARSPTELLAHADRAMYASKRGRQGRARFFVDDDEEAAA